MPYQYSITTHQVFPRGTIINSIDALRSSLTFSLQAAPASVPATGPVQGSAPRFGRRMARARRHGTPCGATGPRQATPRLRALAHYLKNRKQLLCAENCPLTDVWGRAHMSGTVEDPRGKKPVVPLASSTHLPPYSDPRWATTPIHRRLPPTGSAQCFK